jgi:hypothetical protein
LFHAWTSRGDEEESEKGSKAVSSLAKNKQKYNYFYLTAMSYIIYQAMLNTHKQTENCSTSMYVEKIGSLIKFGLEEYGYVGKLPLRGLHGFDFDFQVNWNFLNRNRLSLPPYSDSNLPPPSFDICGRFLRETAYEGEF